jgi:N-hydroxyarylamine O-acetyltransferase
VTDGHALDLDAYLARIGLRGLPSFAALHHAHVTSIPFENLDSLRGRKTVSLQLADLERKLVTEGRGGYCFEQNLLFAAALRALGLQVEPMLARAGPRDDGERAATHLLLRVRAEGAVWHADVGFGAGTLMEPIPFGAGGPYPQAGWRRRVVESGSELVLQSSGSGGAWVDLYRFAPVPVPFVDIEVSNWYTCTHPRSNFVKFLNVTRHLADGSRLVLSVRDRSARLTEQTPAGDSMREIEPRTVPALLAERFELPGWTLDERGVPVPEPGGS